MNSKRYKIKEIYYTLQGEGFHTGRPAIFCRFSGCNLWSGREEDRHKAICQFCDTDFWGTDGILGGRYSGKELLEQIKELWPEDFRNHPIFVVCTGGEPMLQIDQELIDIFHEGGIHIAIETNGTLKVPATIDWICMSPKAGTEIIQQSGNEIKIVQPQMGIDPKDFEEMDFDHFFIQPLDDEAQEDNIQEAIRYCLDNPKWKLSLQVHKVLNIH
jgi:7-carboxy-7-deazaguanine synthase (Cx14CxxC type)